MLSILLFFIKKIILKVYSKSDNKYQRLSLTFEEENSGIISFLNVIIELKSNKYISTAVYIKVEHYATLYYLWLDL